MVQSRRRIRGGAARRRTLRLGFALLGALALVSLPSSLAAAKSPRRASAIADTPTGAVRCAFSGSTTVTPALTSAGGGTGPSRIRGTLSGCTKEAPLLQSGSLSGSFSSSPLSCKTLSATGASIDATVKWTPIDRRVRVSTTTITGDVAGGSFAGTVALTVNVPSTFGASCAARHGIRRIAVSGTFSTAVPCTPVGHVGNPISVFPIGGDVCTSGAYGPEGIVAGSDGALWFVDTANHSIGRITTSGAITIYSQPGLDPAGNLIAGPDGNLWFINTGNPTDTPALCGGTFSIGRITTSDGGPSFTYFTDPRINSPSDLAVGPDGALWFFNYDCAAATEGFGRMTTSGAVSVYPGSGFDQPGDLTAGPDGALWYINVGQWNDSVTDPIIVDSSIGRVTTSGVETQYTDPSIVRPTDLAAGPDGAMWFTNSGNWTGTLPHVLVGSSIGRITSSGVVSSYTGTGVYGPVDITEGPDGAMWFTNYSGECTPAGSCTFTSSIGRITTAGAITDYAPPGGAFSSSAPEDIVVGPDGALWSYDFHQIIHLTTSGSFSYYVDPSLSGAGSIAIGSDGNVWFSNQVTDSIGRIDPP